MMCWLFILSSFIMDRQVPFGRDIGVNSEMILIHHWQLEKAMISPVLRGVGVYLIWNGLWMMMMGFDKHQARRGKWRVRERTLFAGAFCWGALGVWVGMIYFRHKTKHLSFKLGIPVLLIVNWISLIYIMRGWR